MLTKNLDTRNHKETERRSAPTMTTYYHAALALAASLFLTCLDTATAHPHVHFPDPCYDLPAGRTSYDGLQDADEGWELVAFDLHDVHGYYYEEYHEDEDHDYYYDYTDYVGHHNDDGSDVENLNFDFNFFGQMFRRLYINNNGNLSFQDSYSHYSPYGFPIANFGMVAPVRPRTIRDESQLQDR